MGGETATTEAGERAPMGDGGDLAGRVSGFTAALVSAMAVAAFLGWGASEAVGILTGGVISVANFLWLRVTAGRAVQAGMGRPEGGLRRAVFWVASGARFGVVALSFGLVIVNGWVGLGGLLVSLTALPVILVAEGLRAARLG
jgi:hypothetical protein